jgi:hypothetical protein
VYVEEQHAGVGIEDILGAVAVVDVPIHDHDPLAAPLGLRVGCGDRHVVEQAETPCPGRLGMVTGRPDQGEGALGAAAEHGLDCGDRGAGGHFGGLDAAGRYRRGIDVEPGILAAQFEDVAEIGAGVNAPQLLPGGGHAALEGKAGYRFELQQMANGRQSAGMLGIFPGHVQAGQQLAYSAIHAAGQEGGFAIRLVGEDALVIEGDDAVGLGHVQLHAGQLSVTLSA